MTDYSGVSLKTGALHVFEGSTTDKTILQCGTISGDVTITLGGTASGDAAAIGYTSADGIVITGQGSTSDVTIKNDADTAVLTIATGTTNVDVASDINGDTYNLSPIDKNKPTKNDNKNCVKFSAPIVVMSLTIPIDTTIGANPNLSRTTTSSILTSTK